MITLLLNFLRHDWLVILVILAAWCIIGYILLRIGMWQADRDRLREYLDSQRTCYNCRHKRCASRTYGEAKCREHQYPFEN